MVWEQLTLAKGHYEFFEFERRPINPKAIFAACMLALTVGIPSVMLIPKFIEAREGATIPIGAGCTYQSDPN